MYLLPIPLGFGPAISGTVFFFFNYITAFFAEEKITTLTGNIIELNL